MVPDVPRFATIRSVLSAWAVAGELPGFLDDVSIAIGSKSDGEHDLGRGALRLSRDVFGGWLSPQELIEHHTHVPLFASLMSPLQALGWKDRLMTVAGGRDALATQVRRSQQVQAQTLRRCPTCVREDQVRYGCAHWRLFHQWPVARHCAEHGDVLETTCSRCRAPISRLPVPQFADDRCRVCGGTKWMGEPFAGSDAYRSLLNAMYKALRTGTCKTSTPSCRAADAVRRLTIYQDGIAPLDRSEQIFAAWRVSSLEELAGLLGASRRLVPGPPAGGATDQRSSLLMLACDHGARIGGLGSPRLGGSDLHHQAKAVDLARIAEVA